ncbi:hypothetical protein AOQ84DRAFT_361721 [Glonium stellatum]|uniref:Uncharacterized protein n=1 Tax=Glonium stellatum TaxID=574774 RepID=A0A8E2F778_9PEZI|nr:hypothetical protein AOQ84DRAFT_361721 [Glonium stellatum]
MDSRFILTNAALPRDAVKLATLVPNIRNPHQDVLSKSSLTEGIDFHVHIQQNFKFQLGQSKKSLFQAYLTRLISMSYNESEGYLIDFSASEGRTYELKSPETVFRGLCGDGEVRKWLQDRFRKRRKTYFIVGFRTLIDVTIHQREGCASRISAHATAPANSLEAAVNTNMSSLLDVENCWVPSLGVRGKSDEGDEEVVEASLEDLEEIGQLEKLTTEDGQDEYLYLP